MSFSSAIQKILGP